MRVRPDQGMDFRRHAAATPIIDPSMSGRFQATGGENPMGGASGPISDIPKCDAATYA